MTTRAWIAPATALCLSACATAPVNIGPSPECAAGPQCDAEWAAARTFVLDHVPHRIQTYSADFLQTYAPGPYEAQLAADVNKEFAGPNRFRISARFYCNNVFGCFPNPAQTLAQFNQEVAQAGNAVAATK